MEFISDRNRIRNVVFFLVFLSVGCNQKPTQNPVSKQEIPINTGVKNETKNKPEPDKSVPQPSTTTIKEGTKSPALLYGTNPGFFVIQKNETGRIGSFLRDESLQDPGIEDRSYPISQTEGIQIFEHSKANEYGLYFGQFKTITQVTVCGAGACQRAFLRELMLIQTSPEQFDKLFTQAEPFKPVATTPKEWSLYFFDQKLSKFQNNYPAKLAVSNDLQKITLDWNGALDITGKVDLVHDKDSGPSLELIQFEKPVLVGKFKDYLVIGIEQFSIK